MTPQFTHKHIQVQRRHPLVFDPLFINNQLIMDYYIYHGVLPCSKWFTVLNFYHFFGEPIHDCMDIPGFDRPAWIERAFSNADTHTRPWANAVVKKYGSGMKYCAVGTPACYCLAVVPYLFLGFCFGGPQVFDLAKEGSLIICGARVLASCQYVCVISYRCNR
ncbi:uncharacterized protein F5147DRAFT_698673 [Suillus discolor]|uniref:Uncharacterized protein n=1 Tax=Suillus discolor TaxID=1912936 RepID=A0A9P7F6I1_9AGAM|nr:uncharacterized protein F5147DRAFT_698673 [Suillus discolor]KAG2106925.1 hypothetical protein F5147DRAFT_698673 [Suillus discolor]